MAVVERWSLVEVCLYSYVTGESGDDSVTDGTETEVVMNQRKSLNTLLPISKPHGPYKTIKELERQNKSVDFCFSNFVIEFVMNMV